VPRLIGSAEIDFFHSLLIERIEVIQHCLLLMYREKNFALRT